MDGAPAQPEEVLLGAAGGLVLLHGVGRGLAGEPVLEFHGGDGEAVHEEADVQGQLLAGGAVPELPGNGEPVLPVSFFGLGVPRGWSPVEEGDFVRPVVDALPENVDDAPVAYLPLQPVKEPSPGGRVAV